MKEGEDRPVRSLTKSEFTVEFSVSDSQGVIKGTVNIQVGDVNDNAPQFHNQPYSVRIPEIKLPRTLPSQVLTVSTDGVSTTFCCFLSVLTIAKEVTPSQTIRESFCTWSSA
ncbi:hypothetical protein llap_21099 [Limosa lapponica baueri]|uniref:Cadherin domain-containing protein n=1 Tax=Limosa lapponica baueri TaxID=1758121 RepID=A0A2I0T485_LIMLA|nr:hypothetical protein llap_21099 [Limosa lapponica baueri]